MKNFYIATILFIGISLNAQSLGTSLNNPNSRWTFGGGAGLGFSGGSGGSGTSVSVTPRVGYRITDDFEAGLAGSLTWMSSKYWSTTMVGVGPFANYYFGRSVYISGLFQQYWINQKDKVYNQKYNGDEAALYLGGGYMQSIGGGAYMQIGASYNVLYKKNASYFSSGFIPSIGFVFGL